MGLFDNLIKKKSYSGYTEETGKRLLLDAGAYFKNFDVDTDTYESAVADGKLIGATRGGGEFNATPEIRQIPCDGVKGAAKGNSVIDSWLVTIKANVLEVSKETIAAGLCASVIDETDNSKYYVIAAKNEIEDADYIGNITWIGNLSGSSEPVIIQVLNALNQEGLKLTTQDKNEAVITMTFTGYYDSQDLSIPPFRIYYPKPVETTPTEPEETP